MKSFKPKNILLESSNMVIKTNSGPTLKLIPLGGVGDVTKNMYVYEYGNDIIIVDCGVGFPDEAMPGVDLVIPDISYLRDKKEKIRGILITHGHDDHIGGLPYLWPELQCPIYTQRLTAGFIRAKFTEHNLPKNKIFDLKFDDTLKLGVFDISFYLASHSIPDTMGIVINTPVGTIVHQADFKIDWTPVSGQVTDVGRVAQVGSKGVKLLLIDCLRVEKPGFNKSEKSIEETFLKAAEETSGKLLITMTSSNVSRMQQAINVAQKVGRKVALAGRSFENNFQVARDLGYLDVPPGIIVASDAMSTFAGDKLLILIAGSQGQEGSALDRAANDEHKYIKLIPGDSVVFSADPIPSTETAQNALIDSLTNIGVEVYYSAITSDLHVSGHAAQEEIRLMINLIKPEYMLGIGGNYRHMKGLARMAKDMGYKKNQVLDVIDGDTMLISKDDIKVGEKIEVRNIYVDGLGVGDVGTVVLRDRQQMSEEGVVIVIVPLEQNTGKISGEIDVISRGFIFEGESNSLMDEAKKVVIDTLHKHDRKISDWRFVRKMIEEKLSLYLYKATERRPLILPIVVEV
jgi:ribonuclease J